ncbi:hypothetical protein CTI12_AA161460 [Artemisia annua]|uniref:Uncharacterized protein n=1 Tax=Artemisia annua TaxID=35608 RepID=A0A2U1PEL9_ARTAN|nr:hypothetical protein CTI12_AA161460 [Artemisia annua]
MQGQGFSLLIQPLDRRIAKEVKDVELNTNTCSLLLLLLLLINITSTTAQSVQHLIEKCLIFRMSKDECMEALSKHANIKPVITSTVWNELEKENKEFFESYLQSMSQPPTDADQMSEAETSQLIQKMISDRQANGSDNDHKFVFYAVWNELEKENKEFFESYLQSMSQPPIGPDQMSEAETSQLIQKMISDRQANGSDNDDK